MGTKKSIEITALDATPFVALEAGNVKGKMRVFADTVACATGDLDDNDIVVMAELPSNAKVTSIMLYNDDLDSNGSPAIATDVGIYAGGTKFTDTDGSATAYAAEAVIDRDAYASAITTLQAANTAGVECAFEARNINTIANFIWEDAGLSSDPKVPLRIALTIETVAATQAAGDISVVVTYVVD
mgnify:FL=1|jgi:hypothetical protein|tara:strand:- start:2388 stop:2942 length:555 start_codon:yes stop_codon:yes gene_type:complete